MAKLWFLVIVLIFVQKVLADKVLNCDQCIRGGGDWCIDDIEDERCLFNSRPDSWCGNIAKKPSHNFAKPTANTTKAIQPEFMQLSLPVGRRDVLPFTFTLPSHLVNDDPMVHVTLHNTTQNLDGVIQIIKDFDHCDGAHCSLKLDTRVKSNFCSATGTEEEFIFISIKVEGIADEAMIQLHVPCVCECSKYVLKNDKRCHGNGNFSCGICSCHEGWSGKFCTEKECDQHRGDVTQCNNPWKNDEECSSNGKCSDCGTCVCDTDKEGWQYFDPKYYCSDICLEASSVCSPCLASNTMGSCASLADNDNAECKRMTKLKYNETIAAEISEIYGKIWISCKEVMEVDKHDCLVEYVAMKNKDNSINVMVIKYCETNETTAPVVVLPPGTEGSTTSKVPVILGVLALVAVVAAAGGFLLWKHMNAAAPMAFASSDYTNIDPEECTGVNPLYKPPTTTFTNPQFGKC